MNSRVTVRRRSRVLAWLPLAALALLCAATYNQTLASNGMYMISYGARDAGMAGATTAMGGTAMDTHVSPALVGVAGAQWEVGLRTNYATNEYDDRFIDEDPELTYWNQKRSYMVAPLPYAGAVFSLTDRLSTGLLFNVVGGGGGQFSGITRNTRDGSRVAEFLGYDLPTARDTRQLKEDLYARMAHARLTSGVAYSIGGVRVGASVAAGYGKMEMRTTLLDPAELAELPGKGLRYKSDPAYAFTGSAGIAYEPGNDWRVAYAWSGPTVFHMDGSMSVDAGNPEFYHRTGVSMRLAWPEQHRAGIVCFYDEWTVSFDIGYILWRSYMKTIKFTLEDSWVETPIGNRTNTIVNNLHLHNQAVYAIGTEYKWASGFSLRAGYNYARSNTSSDGINPLFSVLIEHHLALGIGMQFAETELDFAIEYGFPNRMEGGNTSNWDLAHAIFGIDDVRTPMFTHSKRMQVVAVVLGVRSML